MIHSHKIANTTLNDLDQVHELFAHSIRYQEERGYPSWRNYDRQAIIRDIESKNQYKVVIDGKIAIVFSVCYEDRIIWRERENGDAFYLHRIVVNPDFKGQRIFGTIVTWSAEHGKQKGLKNLRMDTWANNPTLIDYYKSFGFNVMEDYTLPDSPALPVHNRNLAVTLLELPLTGK